MSECKKCVLMDEETFEKYKRLKHFRFEAAEKIDLIRMMVLRIYIYTDLLDNDLYDYDELLTDIRLTITDLYNYSHEYSNMINNYLKDIS